MILSLLCGEMLAEIPFPVGPSLFLFFFSRLRPRVANKDLTVEMASQASQPVHSERKPRRAASPKSSATAGGFFSKDLENAGPRRAEDLLKLSGIMQLS